MKKRPSGFKAATTPPGSSHRHATSPGQAWPWPETIDFESSFEVFLHSLIFFLPDLTTRITPVENFFCAYATQESATGNA